MEPDQVRRAVFSTLLLGALSSVALAHHSAAMFDDKNRITLEGTVRQFQWNNPHCYIQLVVASANGPAKEWSLEMGAPTYLYNLGWRPSTLKPGEKITVLIAPMRKGDPGGLVLKVTKADGTQFGGRT